MISDGENWHYLTVKNLSRLLRGITSNHDGDFCCLNCFHSYRTKNKLNTHKKICENHGYCNIEMPKCLGENTEKYITFSVPIKKRIENKDIVITYKIKFVYSFRFMATLLSKLVENLTEGINVLNVNLIFVI